MTADYKLWEVSEKLAALDRLLEEAEDPEEIEAILTSMEDVHEDFEVKARDIIRLTEAWQTEAIGLKQLIDRLSKRQRALTNRRTRLLDYLKNEMQKTSTGSVKLDYGRTVSLKQNPESVEILNEAALNPKFIRLKSEPDKQAIKRALKAGEDVIGAQLTRTIDLQIK